MSGITAIRNLSRILFTIVCLSVFLWLSFFVEPIQSKYGGLIVGILFVNLAVAILLLNREAIKDTLCDKNDVFLWLYILIITIGVPLSANRGLAINRYFNYAIPILVIYYLFKCNFRSLINKDKMAAGICIISSAVSFIAILEFILHKNIIYEHIINNPFYPAYISERRSMATQIAPQPLGTYLLACLPMSFFLINKENRRLKTLGILSCVLLVCGIVFSFTRIAVIAALIMLVLYFFRKNRKIIVKILLIFFIMVALFSILGKTKNMPVWRLGIRGFTSQPDYKYRLARYDTTFKILKKHLFLGVGLDNYRYVFDEYHQEKFIPDYWKVPDNMFLSILGETGIFGFFSFILFMIMLLKKGFLFFNSNLKNENTEISFILVLAIMGILFSMMTYDLFYWTVPFYMFWIYCGMLSSITIEPDKRYA